MNNLLWILFFVFCIHNAEEYLTMERFGTEHFKRISREQFLAALVLVTLLALGCVLLGRAEGAGTAARFVALVFPAIMALNALFHLGASLVYRRYTPGVVTGVLAVGPLAVWSMIVAVRSGYLAETLIWWSLAAALLLQYPIIRLSLFLGGLAARRTGRSTLKPRR